MKKLTRILLLASIVLLLWSISSSCSLTPLEAGLAGAAAGTTTTLLLDDYPDIIIGEEGTVIQESPDNAFGLLAVLVENAGMLVFLGLLLWFLPSPTQIRTFIRNKKP